MNTSLIRTSLAGIALLTLVFLVSDLFDDSSNEETLSIETAQYPQNVEMADDIEITSVPKPNTAPVVTKVEDERNPEDNPFFEAETKARLIQVTQEFAQDIQYPDFSKPIRDADELNKYLPNESVASSLDIQQEGAVGPKLYLKTSKYQYFRGEVVTAQARIEGVPAGATIQVQSRLVKLGNTLSQTEGQVTSANSFMITYQPNDIPVIQGSDELRLIATFSVDDQQYELGAPLSYLNSIASIDDVASASVNEAYLEIPVYVTTRQPGYHQLAANLYDAKTGKPLVHLTSEKELSSTQDFLLLRAHAAALKVSGSEGPYVLKDFVLNRMPSAPRYETEYGQVNKASFKVNGVSFADFSDEPYVDEQAQERLEFLSQLGGGA